MADVYMAWDNIRSTKMAVKVLRRDYVNNPHRFQMFAKRPNSCAGWIIQYRSTLRI